MKDNLAKITMAEIRYQNIVLFLLFLLFSNVCFGQTGISFDIRPVKNISFDIKPVKCFYESTKSGSDDYYCEDKRHRYYEKKNLAEKPHKILYGCSGIDDYYRKYDSVHMSANECIKVKKELDSLARNAIKAKYARNMGLYYFPNYIESCRRSFEKKAENYIVNGGTNPTWATIGMEPISYTIPEEFISHASVWAKYNKCENCLTCVEPQNGYGVSLVLNESLEESSCKKGFEMKNEWKQISMINGEKKNYWQPGKIFSIKDDICSKNVFDALNYTYGFDKEKESKITEFRCNEDSLVEVKKNEIINNIKEFQCLKISMDEATTLHIGCENAGGERIFHIKDCEGKIHVEHYSCTGFENKKKWLSVPVGKKCSVLFGNSERWTSLEELTFDEWDGELGPAVNILENDFYFLHCCGENEENNTKIKRRVLEKTYVHIEEIREKYIELLERIRKNNLKKNVFGKIAIHFNVIDSYEKIGHISLNHNIYGENLENDDYEAYLDPFINMIEKNIQSWSDEQGKYGEEITVTIELKPYEKQVDYSQKIKLIEIKKQKKYSLPDSVERLNEMKKCDVNQIGSLIENENDSMFICLEREEWALFAKKIRGVYWTTWFMNDEKKIDGKERKYTFSEAKNKCPMGWSLPTKQQRSDAGLIDIWAVDDINYENVNRRMFVRCVKGDVANPVPPSKAISEAELQGKREKKIAQRKELIKKRSQTQTDLENKRQEDASNAAEFATQQKRKESRSKTYIVPLVISTLVAVTGGAFAYHFDNQAKELIENPPQNQQEFQKVYDDVGEKQTMRAISIGTAVLGILGIGISFLF